MDSNPSELNEYWRDFEPTQVTRSGQWINGRWSQMTGKLQGCIGYDEHWQDIGQEKDGETAEEAFLTWAAIN